LPLVTLAIARLTSHGKFEAATLGTNHFAGLLKSFQLATKQPPPPGYILVRFTLPILMGTEKPPAVG
jgi:hypothetical protein